MFFLMKFITVNSILSKNLSYRANFLFFCKIFPSESAGQKREQTVTETVHPIPVQNFEVFSKRVGRAR